MNRGYMVINTLGQSSEGSWRGSVHCHALRYLFCIRIVLLFERFVDTTPANYHLFVEVSCVGAVGVSRATPFMLMVQKGCRFLSC